jgi:hypothetical protein
MAWGFSRPRTSLSRLALGILACTRESMESHTGRDGHQILISDLHPPQVDLVGCGGSKGGANTPPPRGGASRSLPVMGGLHPTHQMRYFFVLFRGADPTNLIKTTCFMPPRTNLTGKRVCDFRHELIGSRSIVTTTVTLRSCLQR